jgi:hypothetical protein
MTTPDAVAIQAFVENVRNNTHTAEMRAQFPAFYEMEHLVVEGRLRRDKNFWHNHFA